VQNFFIENRPNGPGRVAQKRDVESVQLVLIFGGAAPFDSKGAGFDPRCLPGLSNRWRVGAKARREIHEVGFVFLRGGAAPFGFKGAGFDSRLLLESNPFEFSPLLFPHSASNCSKANLSDAALVFFAPG